MRARAQSAGAMGHPQDPRPVSPGQPEHALPRWHHLPLDAKIPLPRVVPKGKAVMYPAKAGEPLWRTISASLGFDLNDPLLMQLPGPHEYNPLHDPFASGHLRRPDLQDALYCHGLVTRHGFCLSSLKNFNRFREYLHSVNLRQLKHKRTEVEKPLRTEYEHLALDVVREERKKEELEPETAAEGGGALSARYSDIMRDEESKLPDQLSDFYSQLTNEEKIKLDEENKTFATIRFAKIQNREARLVAIKSWLRKDGRKAALLRLRRLQIMEERRKKGVNNWKTRTAVQSELFEELRTRERREAEARRVHLAEKQRYQSAIGFVHDVKYNEVIEQWREKRLRSGTLAFCGYAAEDFQRTFIEPESNNEDEFVDAEIQTDPKDDLPLDKEKTLLFDRSNGLTVDITDGFNADEVREYENAARQLVESALFVHSEVILPATTRYKAELERGEKEAEPGRGGHDASIQTSDSLQQMDPIVYRPDMVRKASSEVLQQSGLTYRPGMVREASTEVLQQQDGSKHGYPVHDSGLVVPGDDTSRSQSSAGSSSVKSEIVYTLVENEVLRVEKDNETDKVELLVVALDALEKVAGGLGGCLDAHTGAIARLLVKAREVLAEAIDIRRNSSAVVEEIVRLAIDDIAEQLQETTPDGRQTEAENLSAERRGRGRRKGRRRQSASEKSSSCSCPAAEAELLTYIVGKAVAIANQSTEAKDDNRSSERQSEVKDDGDEFIEAFLRRISGAEEEKEEATTHRLSALVSACDDFNDAMCDRYARMDLSEREFIQLARDRTMNEANRLVTASVKKVLEDLGGEGLEMNDPVSHVDATRAIAEALLNLALHRDLEQITKEYRDPRQIIDLVARIVRTHGSVRDSAGFAVRSAVGDHSSWTRWHLSPMLLNRLIRASLDRVTAEQRTCGLTTELLISLAAAVNLRGLASNVVLQQPKKGRLRRRCPRQPPVIDQTKFRSSMIDSFSDKMKQLVDWAVLPDACVDHALSQAIQTAASAPSSLVTSPKRLSQHTTALLADVKSTVGDAARAVLRRTVGNLAAKLRASNDSQVECALGQIENALSDIDAYGLLNNESQLGLRARNSIELSRERLKEISPSTHWSATEHSASDEEVNDRVSRKMSLSSKVVRVTLIPTDPNLIHEPYLPTPDSSDQSPIRQAPSTAAAAIKAPQSSVAIDDLVEEMNVMPMYGSVPLDIDPDFVTEDLLVLSIKRDSDLDNPDLSKRNSFRNVHRPDVSSIRRFSSSSSSGGQGSIHERAKDVYIQRRSTLEDDIQHHVQTTDDSEYVIRRITIPATDSVPEFWPTDPDQSGADGAPIQSTVTTEYSKEYRFPEDAQPAVSGSEILILRPDRAPDEISIISYLYGDPEEFHHLKISSTIIDDEESSNLIAEDPANENPPPPHQVGSDGKPVPVEESDEVVIASRVIFDPSRDPSEQFPSHEPSKDKPASGPTNDDVTLNLEAAATELLKHDSGADTSSKHLLDRSTDSVVLPPVPANSTESRKEVVTANSSRSGVTGVTTQPLGVAADFNSKDVDHEGDFGESNE